VNIGHINLAKSFDSTGEHVVSLVEALHEEHVAQHAIVRNPELAKRLGIIGDVVVGPVVRSAISAYCMMPSVDLVHIHDVAASRAGLLLALTRGTPFVLTHRDPNSLGKDPLTQVVYKRAAGIICLDDSDVALLHHYDPSLHIHIVPDVGRSGSARRHLSVYQNSQRIPIAGRSGIQ